MDMSAFVDQFRAEALEHLRSLDAQLLELERSPTDPAPVRAMFLSAHTIKGGAAMMGLEDARSLAHAMEDVLGCLRDRGQPLDGTTADLLFRSVDVLRGLIEEPATEAASSGSDLESLIADLRRRAEADVQSVVSKLHVLLVEDSATVRFLEESLLKEAGYDVTATADGCEALSLALGKSFAVVVAGMETEGLGGQDLAAALRESTSCQALPVILMGSEDDAERRQQALQAGARAYLRRGSYRDRQLVEAVRELL